VSDLLAEQKRYYAERAPEYDDWWYRHGRYELEPDVLARWRADIAEVEAGLEAFGSAGTVLELAAGTGIWTRKLLRLAERVVAVDANAETLALNTSDAELVRADVFEWRPAEHFDLVFFSFWLWSLADGRTFRIVKRRWQPDELAERVRPLGFELDLRDTANGHFLFGGGSLT
jgi:SAM-dependent methyltransferase